MKNGFSFSQAISTCYTPGQLNGLHDVTIGIAGLGGIGSNVAIMLVRSGLIRLLLADFDVVSASNLNRQAYLPCHIDRLKTDCLTELCKDINPEIDITSHAVRIDSSNAIATFTKCDIIIEAFDDAAAKAMLFSEFLASEKIIIGVSGIAGIGSSNNIISRQIRPNCYIVGDLTSAVSETTGPYAPRVMVAAAKMADIALDHALRSKNSRIDRVPSQ